MDRSEMMPVHIGIIMDGNGRWAKKRGLPRSAGHKAGAKVFEDISRYARDIGVKWLTVYAFSTENWSRPEDEVKGLMTLMKSYLKNMESAVGEDIAVRFIGDRGPLDNELKALMEKAENAPVKNIRLTVQIALNYGGRAEILKAVRSIAKKVSNGEILPDNISEDDIAKNLYSKDAPDPDLIIRPSGEKRISNFLLWQCAYSEFVYMDVLWPDFTHKDLDKAIEEYYSRNRRFGGVAEVLSK